MRRIRGWCRGGPCGPGCAGGHDRLGCPGCRRGWVVVVVLMVQVVLGLAGREDPIIWVISSPPLEPEGEGLGLRVYGLEVWGLRFIRFRLP